MHIRNYSQISLNQPQWTKRPARAFLSSRYDSGMHIYFFLQYFLLASIATDIQERKLYRFQSSFLCLELTWRSRLFTENAEF